uniref:Ar-de n=1 Tax=Limoniastrum monopetalum TaxID=63095 RepID=G8GBT5_9CARY|nr:ar-de [Limoniastrum monopetalum]
MGGRFRGVPREVKVGRLPWRRCHTQSSESRKKKSRNERKKGGPITLGRTGT